MDDILCCLYDFISSRPTNNKLSDYKSDSSSFISQPLRDIGVRQWKVDNSLDDVFDQRRSNIGLVDLFYVLMGAIQIIVGATVARRQGELIDLDPQNCLAPRGVNPLEKTTQEFELVFHNRKTGIGGELPLREVLSKPILKSVACLIYKLKLFNKKITKCKFSKPSISNLLFSVDSLSLKFCQSTHSNYNFHLNSFCDYFEVDVVEYKLNDFRRYYIRQHQLRRFFAMVFFWSKSFDGLDTLRHFLGHSDMEHLYHYVTEGSSGEVLAGVKAECIVEGLKSRNIKNIERLGPILKSRFNTLSISIKSINEILEDYDETFQTAPSLIVFEEAKNNQKELISSLLLDGKIDLQPEFFTLKDETGKEIRDYTLVMHVKDLED